MINTLASFGNLTVQKTRRKSAPLAWMLSNYIRWYFIKGWLAVHVIAPIAKSWGLLVGYSELRALLIRRNGERVNYGVLGYRVVTDTGVAFVIDDWDNSTTDITNFKYHGAGTGTGAEAVGDTGLGTEATTGLNPDNTRATGTNTQPSANVLQTVGTLTFDASLAITEHGIFSQAATGGGTLWDRTKFTAINVVSGDSIQFTYSLTLTSGG